MVPHHRPFFEWQGRALAGSEEAFPAGPVPPPPAAARRQQLSWPGAERGSRSRWLDPCPEPFQRGNPHVSRRDGASWKPGLSFLTARPGGGPLWLCSPLPQHPLARPGHLPVGMCPLGSRKPKGACASPELFDPRCRARGEGVRGRQEVRKPEGSLLGEAALPETCPAGGKHVRAGAPDPAQGRESARAVPDPSRSSASHCLFSRINNLRRSVLPPPGWVPAALRGSGTWRRLVLIRTAVPSGGAGARRDTRGGPGDAGTVPSSSPAAAGLPGWGTEIPGLSHGSLPCFPPEHRPVPTGSGAPSAIPTAGLGPRRPPRPAHWLRGPGAAPHRPPRPRTAPPAPGPY